jgi:septum site-determining protein MinC
VVLQPAAEALPSIPPSVVISEAAPQAATPGAAPQAATPEADPVAPEASATSVPNEEAENETASASAEAHADVAETDMAEATAEPAETPPPAKESKPAAPHVMYLKQTLRSGQAISHKGHLVIIGDVNPGAEVIAEGDITVWGSLRGIAHAGVGGNLQAEIRALRFEPIQLRIAHAIARSPDRPRGSQKYNGPETARIVNGTIRIASSAPD